MTHQGSQRRLELNPPVILGHLPAEHCPGSPEHRHSRLSRRVRHRATCTLLLSLDRRSFKGRHSHVHGRVIQHLFDCRTNCQRSICYRQSLPWTRP